MGYLSPQIAALAKKKNSEASLVKKEYSCGIFQDYGHQDSATDSKELEG
tara:strand:- start:277 stop:423 length:147 start_codon:yes stop_codon:yes gene_type:complete